MFTTTKEKEVVSRILHFQAKRGAPDKHLYTAINVSHHTWNNRVKGNQPFNLRELIIISDVLGVTLADLLADAGQEKVA